MKFGEEGLQRFREWHKLFSSLKIAAKDSV